MYSDIVSLRRFAETNLEITRIRRVLLLKSQLEETSQPNHRKSEEGSYSVECLTMLRHHGHQSAPQRFVTLQVARAIFADASQLFDWFPWVANAQWSDGENFGDELNFSNESQMDSARCLSVWLQIRLVAWHHDWMVPPNYHLNLHCHWWRESRRPQSTSQEPHTNSLSKSSPCQQCEVHSEAVDGPWRQKQQVKFQYTYSNKFPEPVVWAGMPELNIGDNAFKSKMQWRQLIWT